MHICLGILYLNIPCEIECIINIHFKIFLEHICLIYIAYILTCLHFLSFIFNLFYRQLAVYIDALAPNTLAPPCEIECVINIHFVIFSWTYLSHIYCIYINMFIFKLYHQSVYRQFLFLYYIIHMCIEFRYKYHEL